MYRGVEYHGCVTSDGGGAPWCATAVTSSGAPLRTDECPLDWGEKSTWREIEK